MAILKKSNSFVKLYLFHEKVLGQKSHFPIIIGRQSRLHHFSCILNLNHFTDHLITTITQSIFGVKIKK